MGTPASNPTGSPSRFQNPQAGVRPPRPAVGPGQGQQAGQGSQNSKFPLLQYMTTEQLQALLDNEDQMKEMVEDVDDVSCHGCTRRQIKDVAVRKCHQPAKQSLGFFNLHIREISKVVYKTTLSDVCCQAYAVL